jgi:hypothetical protein
MVRSTAVARAAALGAAVAMGVLAAAGVASPAAGQPAPTRPAPPPSTPPEPPPPEPRTTLVLAVVPQDEPATVATLTCGPTGGTHPLAPMACRDLQAAGGDFTRLPGDPFTRVCPDVWDPVTAAAVGWWEGRVTWFRQVYGNACELRASTGPVFALTPLVGPSA